MVGTAAVTEDMLKRRWSASILRYLDNGVSDPAEITKREPNLSPAIMSQRLRTMLRYNLVARYPRPAPSKIVEFRLTPRGKKILRMLDVIDRLDQLDHRLALDGKSIEEDLGLVAPANSCRPSETATSTTISEPPIKKKKSNGTTPPIPISVQSSP